MKDVLVSSLIFLPVGDILFHQGLWVQKGVAIYLVVHSSSAIESGSI